MVQMTPAEVEAIVSRTVIATMASFGIDEGDHRELRADLHLLRRWRRSVEQAQGFTFKAIITVIVSGFIGALWLGIKISLGK